MLNIKGPIGAGALHKLDGYSDDWIGAANQRASSQIVGSDDTVENLPNASSIPFWLSWALRRVVDPGGNQLGSLKVTWVTNVNLGAYVFQASGLVLLDHRIMPDFLRRLIVRG